MERLVPIRRSVAQAAILTLLLAACFAVELHAQTAHCRAVGSNPSAADPAYLRSLARSTDSTYIRARAKLGMAQSDSMNIQNVLNEPVCAKMVKTMDSVQAYVDPTRKVYLYKFANGWFGANDPNATPRLGVQVWFFYNSSSKYKGSFALGGG